MRVAEISSSPESSERAIRSERPWVRFYDEHVPPTLSYPAVPLPRLLELAAQSFPERVALIYSDRQLTYRELDGYCNRFATALLELGLRPGDRVALLLPNLPQFVIAYYGTLKMGGVVVPTNPLYVEREVQHQMADSGARAVVVLDRLLPLTKATREAAALEQVIVVPQEEVVGEEGLQLAQDERRETRGKGAAVGRYSFNELLRLGAAEAPDLSVSPSDLALLQYTGGTTGVPKGAMLTHANLVCNTVQICRWLHRGPAGEGVVLGALPFFHVYGMTVAMNFALNLGASLVIMPRFEVQEALRLISRYRPTIFPGVPTMYVAINNCPETPQHDLRSIEACLSGAAPLPAEVQRQFEAITGGRLVEGYGLTEAAPVTHCNPTYGQRRAGSIGVPLPDVDARIVDLEKGETELPIGQVGELVVRGPQVMRGYWNMPEETATVLRNGWLYTGDVARRDEDGYFYLVDRKKDVIIASGFNIYPREIDEVLYAHPKVREAVAVGIPDPYRGETVKVFVVLKSGEVATEEEIIGYCRQHLARYKVPTAVEFRSSLPKSMVGKVLRRALLEEERKRQ